MAAAIALRDDFDGLALRRMSKRTKDAAQTPRPCPERRVASAQAERRRPSAVDERRPEIDVAALGDPAEPGLSAGGHPARHEAEPRGQVPAVREVLRLADRSRQRGGVQRACAGYRRQPPRRREARAVSTNSRSSALMRVSNSAHSRRISASSMRMRELNPVPRARCSRGRHPQDRATAPAQARARAGPWPP